MGCSGLVPPTRATHTHNANCSYNFHSDDAVIHQPYEHRGFSWHFPHLLFLDKFVGISSNWEADVVVVVVASCTQDVANVAAFSAAQLAALRFIPFIMSVFISPSPFPGHFHCQKYFKWVQRCSSFYLLLESVPPPSPYVPASFRFVPKRSFHCEYFIRTAAAASRLHDGYGYICSYSCSCRYRYADTQTHRYSRLYMCRYRYTYADMAETSGGFQCAKQTPSACSFWPNVCRVGYVMGYISCKYRIIITQSI